MSDESRQLLEEISDLAHALQASLEAFKANVRDLAPDGLSRGGDGSRSAPGHSDPTPRVALSRREALKPLFELQVFVNNARNDLRRASSLVHQFTVVVESKPERQSVLMECGNPDCDAAVTGVAGDRLRMGRCPRCYHYRYRTGLEWTPRVQPDTTTGEVAS